MSFKWVEAGSQFSCFSFYGEVIAAACSFFLSSISSCHICRHFYVVIVFGGGGGKNNSVILMLYSCLSYWNKFVSSKTNIIPNNGENDK